MFDRSTLIIDTRKQQVLLGLVRFDSQSTEGEITTLPLQILHQRDPTMMIGDVELQVRWFRRQRLCVLYNVFTKWVREPVEIVAIVRWLLHR